MSNTIWELVNSNATVFAGTDLAPYSANGKGNFYELFRNSERPSRQREHALNHCFAMAEHYCAIGQFPLSCDWVVSAAAIADEERPFFQWLFELWNGLLDTQVSTWPELLRKPPEKIRNRLIGLTLVRVCVAAHVDFTTEHSARLIEFTRAECSDVFERLKINDKQQPFEQLRALKSIDVLLAEKLQTLKDASTATDLRTIQQRVHGITQTLTDGLVRGLMTLQLPTSFAKTNMPALFKTLEPLVNGRDVDFIEHVDFARAEIKTATTLLRANLTFYAAKYLIPLIEHLSHLVEQAYQSSDATKPARVSVHAYPRKYPFHARGSTVRLRFIAENHGPGPASDIEITFTLFHYLEPAEKTIWISGLGTGKQAIDLDVCVGDVGDQVEFYVQTVWNNVDSTRGEGTSEGFLQCQNSYVDWDRLSDPYSIEAIDLDSERPFVGRKADVQQLLRSLAGKSMGSHYVYGQKRVGKTSLVLEVASHAAADISDFHHCYLEGGDYVQPTAEGTLQSLGRQIARRLRKCHRLLERIPLPEFNNSLSPLNEFVDEILDVLPDAKFLLILDEFDELPLELFKRGPVGDGFFLTLRALSGRPRVGIILIGGEKMGPIISAQGDQLNRFSPLRVDYFRREEHWGDFQELVRSPVEGQIEFSESAIEALYRWSAGNPFFTNVICKEVMQRCCDRRDAFVSELEIEECASLACRKAGANSFQHFWEDGVLDTGGNTEDVSIRRRRVLLALAATLRDGSSRSRENLAMQRDLIATTPSALENELKRFVERGILLVLNNEYVFRVFMFERFLTERSSELISTEFTDQDERKLVERQENKAFVHSSEIKQLIDSWGAYCSVPVIETRVRSWLIQFGSNKDQRVMFQLLKSLRFYSEPVVQEKLRSAMGFIGRETTKRPKEGERFRRDLLVSHLGGIAKSGTQYARMFCQENKVMRENAVGWEGLGSRLRSQRGELQAVVVIDDFVGTGGTAIDSLTRMNEQIGNDLRASEVKLFLIIICGFADALEKVRKVGEDLKLPLEIYCSDILSESDRAFSVSSIAFETDGDRLRARDLARGQGESLERKWPLGHGNCEALVVFFANCPNNTLPIIFKSGADWTALFPRR
jgi:hypothetical protein